MLDLLAPGPIFLTLQMRYERAQRVARVAHEVDLHRIAHADHATIEVDLDAPRLALLRKPLRVRKARANHQEGVTALHHLVARPRPEQTDRAGYERQVVGHCGASVQRLGYASAENLCGLDHLVGRAERSLADQHGDLGPGVQHLGGAAQVLVMGNDARLTETGPREERSMLAWRLRVRLLLHVCRKDYAAHRAGRLRYPDRPIDQVTNLRGRVAHVYVLVRDVLEETDQVDLLLIVAAKRDRLLLADDREHRLVIELGVVETVQEVDRARTGGRHADAQLTGELCVAAGGKGGDLLVAGLYELDPVAVFVERPHDAVDAVAGVPVDARHAPLVEALEDELRDGFLCHREPFSGGKARHHRCDLPRLVYPRCVDRSRE